MLLSELLEGIRSPNVGIERTQRLLHVFFRYLLTKGQQLGANVGVFLLFHLLPYKPLQHTCQGFLTGFTHPAEQPRNGLLQQRLLVQLNLKILLPLQILAKTADQPVDETVNGHDTEILVAMHHGFAQQSRSTLECFGVQGQYLKQGGAHGSAALSDFAHVLQDAFLHLLCCEVGEGDGQNVPERLGVIFP